MGRGGYDLSVDEYGVGHKHNEMIAAQEVGFLSR